MLFESGKQIIGFDLNEVGDAEWDANVGARVLYKMCLLQAASHPIL
jgi:agmatinase